MDGPLSDCPNDALSKSNDKLRISKRLMTYVHVNILQKIGIGQELKLVLGQRDHLSDIDIAQLRDMYECNEKQDRDETGNQPTGNIM